MQTVNLSFSVLCLPGVWFNYRDMRCFVACLCACGTQLAPTMYV